MNTSLPSARPRPRALRSAVRGFTMMELLVVLAILGLLAGLAIAAAAGGEAGQAALMVNQARSIDNQSRFSRSHDQEADSGGIRTLYNSGFNP